MAIYSVEFSPMVTLCCCVVFYRLTSQAQPLCFFFPKGSSTVTLSRRNHVNKVKVPPIRDCVYNEHSLRRAPLFTISLPIKKASPATLLCFLFFLSFFLLIFSSPTSVSGTFSSRNIFYNVIMILIIFLQYFSLQCNMISRAPGLRLTPLSASPPYAEPWVRYRCRTKVEKDPSFKGFLQMLHFRSLPQGSVTIVHLVSSCRSI